MHEELEAKFARVDHDLIRQKLEELQAVCVMKKTSFRRQVFTMPKSSEIGGAWARVRDEGNKITMSIKLVEGEKIEDQKEICLTVDNFETGISFLEKLGCKFKSYQETKREMWKFNDCEICLDEWPFLETYVEIEGPSSDKVKKTAEQLGFDWANAKFGAIDVLYEEKYGISRDRINNQTPEIVFNMKNPFL